MFWFLFPLVVPWECPTGASEITGNLAEKDGLKTGALVDDGSAMVERTLGTISSRPSTESVVARQGSVGM